MHCFSRFQYFSYIVVVSFIRGGNRSTRTVLSQVSDNLCHIMLYPFTAHPKDKLCISILLHNKQIIISKDLHLHPIPVEDTRSYQALYFVIPILQLYRGGQFYPWKKPEYPYRTIASLWQPLSHNVVSRIPRLSGIRTHIFCVCRHWLRR
jgi:hypothetical protein